MNMPVPVNPNLPAHLAALGQMTSMANFNADAVSGISMGKAHPRISIKQNRWRLLDEQGQVYVVPALYLDVIIVGVNKNVSKMFYAQAFNPSDPEPPAPTCFSDNGVGPSVRSTAPQCGTCAACPNNVWGSKITPGGAKIKACADSKKFAVLLADNPTGNVYELRVPAASMSNIAELADTLQKRNEALPSMVLRLTFDETSQYPKVIFTPVQYINPEQTAAVLEVMDGEEVVECVGKDDTAIGLNSALAATPPQVPAAMPVPPTLQPQQAFAPIPAPLPPAPQFAQQLQPLPIQAQAQAAPEQPAFNPMAPRAASAQPEAPAKRTRRTKTQIAEANGAVPVQTAPVPAPAFNPMMPAAPMPVPTYMPPPGMPAAAAPHPVMQQPVAAQPAPPAAFAAPLEIPTFLRRDVPGAMTPAAAVQIAPQATDAGLDAMLGDAMKR